MSNPSLRRRPSRAVPAIIVSILLIALGVALTWVSIAKLVDGSWPTFLSGSRKFAADLTWQSNGGMIVAGIAVVVGIVLLLTAIIPGRRNAVFLTPVDAAQGDAAQGDAAPATERAARTEEFILTRKAIARLAAAEADRVDGVSSVSATATARRVSLDVTTPLRDTAALKDQVIREVTARLGAVHLSPAPTVLASVTTKDS